MDFGELKDYYNSYDMHRGCFNGSLGEIYNHRYDNIKPLSCGKWNCPKCRPKLKYQLYLDTLKYVIGLGLNKHFTMTFEGNKFRKEYTQEQSYYMMIKAWHKFHKVIEYNYYKKKNAKYKEKIGLDYILFPRSQQNGYCHFHCLIPDEINWKFLNEKRKLYPEMGFVWINLNEDVADYLHNDFFKDSEYIIPLGIRHYNTSRGIKMDGTKNNFFQDDNAMILGKHTVEEMQELINEKFAKPLPNAYLFRKYYK